MKNDEYDIFIRLLSDYKYKNVVLGLNYHKSTHKKINKIMDNTCDLSKTSLNPKHMINIHDENPETLARCKGLHYARQLSISSKIGENIRILDNMIVVNKIYYDMFVYAFNRYESYSVIPEQLDIELFYQLQCNLKNMKLFINDKFRYIH